MRTTDYSSSDYTILIVDNHILIQDFIRSCLEDSFQVVSAFSAEQALNRIENYGCFDVVISSHSLPGMDGLELLRKIHTRYPETIRILMSGGSGDHIEIKQALEEEHISRILHKPFSPSALKYQLKKDLDSIKPATGN